MECFVYAFFMLIHITSVVFFIRFLVFISEQIGFYSFIDKYILILLKKWNI